MTENTNTINTDNNNMNNNGDDTPLPSNESAEEITQDKQRVEPGLICFLYFIASQFIDGDYGNRTLNLWLAFGFFALANAVIAYRSTYRPEYASWRWIDLGFLMASFVLSCVYIWVPISDAVCWVTMFTVPFVASLISFAAKDPFVRGATQHMNLEEKLTPTIHKEFTLWMSVYLTSVFAIMAAIASCTFLVPEYPIWVFLGSALGFLALGFAGCFSLFHFYERKAQNQETNENEDCPDDGTDSMV